MAPLEVDAAKVEANMAKIAATVAARNAVVESWGYGHKIHVTTAQETDAELQELGRKEPPRLGLGYPLPEDGEEERNIIEERKWRAGSLRKNMGLQASKPRDPAEKTMRDAASHAPESSGDEEEGRTGLGKAKNSNLASKSKGDVGSSMKKRVKPSLVDQISQESVAQLPNFGTRVELGEKMNNIQAWSEDATRSLDTPHHPDITAPSWETQDPVVFEAADSSETTEKITVAEEAELRESVRACFEKPQDSRKRKHKDSIDTRAGDKHSAENPEEILMPSEVSEPAAATEDNQFKRARRLPVSESVRQISKSQVSDSSNLSSTNKEAKTELGMTPCLPKQADIDAKAKSRQLAREKLGSGLTSQKSKGAKGSRSALKVKKSKR